MPEINESGGASHDELRKWWNEHQKKDADRDKKLRASAAAKLTADERRAVGLNT
jgi:hypothetical protein